MANAKLLSLAQQRAGQLQGNVDAAKNNLNDKENSLSAAQDELSAIEDKISNAQDNLEKAINAENDRIDKLIDAEEKKIEGIEKKIKADYEDKIDELNKESDKLSNDLALMDYAADKINEKYDKQIEALEKVSKINEDIARSQQQQLGLADALSQGDIAAAARAAQEMRASDSESALSAQMSSIDQARNKELDALRGAETGMTREQISERQFQISQAIYKLETHPDRLILEEQIKDIKKQIVIIEEGRAAAVEKVRIAAQAEVEAAKAGLKAAQDKVAAAEKEDIDF